MNEFKSALLVSSLLNLLFFGISIVFLSKRGGLKYLISKIKQLQNSNLKEISMYDSSFYQDKKSHFENLSKSEANIIFLGDSLTDLCEWAEILQDNRIINRGICGDTTAGILNRINNIIESTPQKLFIMIGINDLNQGVAVEVIVHNYKLILKTFNNQIPDAKIFIQSLLPINNQIRDRDVNKQVIDLNANLKEMAQAFAFRYIDLFPAFLDENNQLSLQYTSDGVHLNGQGYLVWKEIIEKYVVD